MDLTAIYQALWDAYGPQNWWPTTLPGDTGPTYNGKPLDAQRRFEIAVGAILTQNTNWGNVEKALRNLIAADTLSPEKILADSPDNLAERLRPSGYFRIKAARLKSLAAWWNANIDARRPPRRDDWKELRVSLLAVKGVGPETADSVLLYCFDAPTFVIDAYTKRAMARHFGLPANIPYETARALFMDNLPNEPKLFQEFHALFVRLAKEACRKNVCLESCPLRRVERHRD